jgi:flap endonuclease-1
MTMYLRIIARLQDVWMLIVVYSTKRMTVSLFSVIFLLTFCHRDDKQSTPELKPDSEKSISQVYYFGFSPIVYGVILGVNLREIVPKAPVDLKKLNGKSIAIDAYNALYQFLAIIRQPDGTPLKDSTGKITSHLSGLFYRTSNLLEMGIKPVYVFDGVPPALKETEIKRRRKAKEEATILYEHALARGDLREARVYAQGTSRLKDYMEEDSKKLLSLMGLPWVQAPSEGEAQAAQIARRGDADYCASQDYDSLLFGAPKLIRNLTISGRRKLPSKNIYVDVVPELVVLNDVLKECEITYEQLIDVGVLIGTDFNPDGIKGLGPKTALKLIKENGTLEKALPHIKNAEFPTGPEKIRDIFLHPRVSDNYNLQWKEPNPEGIVDFLCRQRDFSEDRVKRALDRIQEATNKLKGKTTLEKWFG